MPLGKISSQNIKKAFEILNELEQVDFYKFKLSYFTHYNLYNIFS